MDDGYAWSFGFATECFTLAEVKLLAAALQANFGPIRPYLDGHRLWILSESHDVFVALVRPHL